MTVINGKEIASRIIGDLKKRPKPEKFMAVILVGNDPISVNFIKQKEKAAEELGIDFRLYNFLESLNNDELRGEVRKIAEHKTCGGVIVQLPLPEHINKNYILNVVPRKKDIDVIGERALGAFYTGRNPVLPSAVSTVDAVCRAAGIKYQDVKIAVVGLGFLIGKPVSVWLMGKAKELMLLDKLSDLSIIKSVDIVISGAGQVGLLKPGMLKDGAGVIDFGYSMENGKISGDLDASGDLSKLSFYTPTPGGTGPISVTKLFENFYGLN
jgi:methylenetetrahydrofolate dehydrogenase (NADP+)/methenyltetrahydrofolate cyclohydrolase